MAAMKLKGISLNTFLWVYSLCLCVSCFKNPSNYPYVLENAIDLFFIENENDSILNILNDEKLLSNFENFKDIKDIFTAAALSESGWPDSARTILLSIDSSHLNEKDKYYYKTIQALVEFRLNKLQEFTKIANPLLTAEVIDIRCMALIQRLMARTMIYSENYEAAIHLLLSSSKLFRQMKLEKSVAVNKKFLASYYSQLGSYDLAIQNLNEAEKTFKEYNDLDELYYLYLIGLKTYVSLDQPDIARWYANLALTTTGGALNNQKLASIYNYIGMIEKHENNYNEAIKMFENVIHLENDYFGASTIEIESYISLASIYNITGNFDKAKENALIAIGKVENNENTFLKYEAYKELSRAYYDTDPLLAYTCLDSAKNNLKRYKELSSKGIADFVNTQYALIGAKDKIIQLEEIKNRNRIINYLILTVLIIIIIAYNLVNSLNKKMKETSTELVKKNLAQLEYEQKVNKLITKQNDVSENLIDKNSSNEYRSDILYSKFNSWLEKDKKYIDPDIDLNMAAREIGTNRSYLSKSINQHGVGFSEIINRYRIREVIKIFEDEDDERNNYTLPEIATVIGFHTKSVFYDSFRKETGMTPSQFRENIQYTKTMKD